MKMMRYEEKEIVLCHISQLDPLQQTQNHLLQGVSLHSFSASACT